MKVLCDVHISYKLVTFLKSKGCEAIHVNAILDKWNTKDADICMYADNNDYIIISKDSDFRDSYFLRNTPQKLIRIILGNTSNEELLEIFETHFEEIKKCSAKKQFYIEIGMENINGIIFP